MAGAEAWHRQEYRQGYRKRHRQGHRHEHRPRQTHRPRHKRRHGSHCSFSNLSPGALAETCAGHSECRHRVNPIQCNLQFATCSACAKHQSRAFALSGNPASSVTSERLGHPPPIKSCAALALQDPSNSNCSCNSVVTARGKPFVPHYHTLLRGLALLQSQGW